ncbi:hypothetical protein DID88_009213 [Monilinia fructigena]|uniref:tripeptidyl-peptidase II n=1 Tax=Monilinia fructigena TaxID=38457 RepID=A0A395IEZ0_9HELO|nr:hypothetical protein DID88_009213 [Monilinia fructigena]
MPQPRFQKRATTANNVSFEACSKYVTPQCIKELYSVGNYTPSVSSGSRIGFGSFLNQSALYTDLFQFEELFNIPAQNFSVTLINGGVNDQNPKTAQIGEANLDVQNIIGVAHPLPVEEFITGGSPPFIPNVDLPTAADNSNEPYLPYYEYLLSKPNSALPQVISNSYGDIEDTVPYAYASRVCNLIGILGIRGISVLESSGDTGVGAGCVANDGSNSPYFQAQFPGTCPYITSVGGTQAVSPEVAWKDGSGGFSSYFQTAWYQKDAVDEYLSKHISPSTKEYYKSYTNFSGRGFPDISAHSLTPDYEVVTFGKKSLSGGTSAAAPVIAGIIGLLNDARLKAGGGSVGCNGVNGQSGQPVPGGAVIPYASWNSTVGWDPVTGLGTPNFDKLKQFLNGRTEKYRVESLPDIPFDIGEMYAGLMPIDMKNKSRGLYFVFEPTVGEPVDEVTIWLNGGPGCSSLEAFFQENGRFIWSWGMYTPQINPYSWVNLTNVLWVEQPVGTGFSIGEVTATSEEEIAEDFVSFFLNFQKTFGIKNFKIYVTGESYAGRYVPYISLAMLERNDTDHFDLSGALAYDPVIGSYVYAQQEAPAVPFLLQNNNVLGLNASFVAKLEALHKSCGYANFIDQYLTFPPSGIQPPKYFDYNNSTDLAYVKKAMHAPMEIDWNECSGPVFIGGDGGPEQEGDLSADPIQSVLPRVIEATNRFLIANGALDFEILTNGTLLAIQNMTWGGKLGFQEQPTTPIVITLPDLQYGSLFLSEGFGQIDEPQGTMGVQHYERGLMWAETYLSGHMQPQFQPRSSYRHLQWVLGRIDEL